MDKIEEPWYDPDHTVRRVRPSGEFKWGGCSSSSAKPWPARPSASPETEDGDWIVRFAAVDLGLIDRASKKLRRFASPRPCR
ncbi:MAG TPA: hypothetical protein VLR47_11245, partial [Rhodospirillales bacterium]|nr:hypothetical protein [Rhodospirillales bacterium]